MKNNMFASLSFLGAMAIVAVFVAIQNADPWIAPAEANKLKNPIAGDTQGGKAENLYSFNCERCHGTDGKGDGLDGKKMDPKPTDLTTEQVQKQSDGAIFWKISKGRGGMVAFENSIKENDRWRIVNYIRRLENSQKPVSSVKPVR